MRESAGVGGFDAVARAQTALFEGHGAMGAFLLHEGAVERAQFVDVGLVPAFECHVDLARVGAGTEEAHRVGTVESQGFVADVVGVLARAVASVGESEVDVELALRLIRFDRVAPVEISVGIAVECVVLEGCLLPGVGELGRAGGREGDFAVAFDLYILDFHLQFQGRLVGDGEGRGEVVAGGADFEGVGAGFELGGDVAHRVAGCAHLAPRRGREIAPIGPRGVAVGDVGRVAAEVERHVGFARRRVAHDDLLDLLEDFVARSRLPVHKEPAELAVGAGGFGGQTVATAAELDVVVGINVGQDVFGLPIHVVGGRAVRFDILQRVLLVAFEGEVARGIAGQVAQVRGIEHRGARGFVDHAGVLVFKAVALGVEVVEDLPARGGALRFALQEQGVGARGEHIDVGIHFLVLRGDGQFVVLIAREHEFVGELRREVALVDQRFHLVIHGLVVAGAHHHDAVGVSRVVLGEFGLRLVAFRVFGRESEGIAQLVLVEMHVFHRGGAADESIIHVVAARKVEARATVDEAGRVVVVGRRAAVRPFVLVGRGAGRGHLHFVVQVGPFALRFGEVAEIEVEAEAQHVRVELFGLDGDTAAPGEARFVFELFDLGIGDFDVGTSVGDEEFVGAGCQIVAPTGQMALGLLLTCVAPALGIVVIILAALGVFGQFTARVHRSAGRFGDVDFEAFQTALVGVEAYAAAVAASIGGFAGVGGAAGHESLVRTAQIGVVRRFVAVGLSVESAEHHAGGLDGVGAGRQPREFLRHIGGGGLAVDGGSSAGRHDFVVDLVDRTVAFERLDGDFTVVGALHGVGIHGELELGFRDADVLCVDLSHVAAVEAFYFEAIVARRHAE